MSQSTCLPIATTTSRSIIDLPIRSIVLNQLPLLYLEPTLDGENDLVDIRASLNSIARGDRDEALRNFARLEIPYPFTSTPLRYTLR